MTYEKQTWNKYDDLKTEEENIENGAVVTDNRMNHIENGIGDNDANLASHLADKNNPHKVTAAQVGLGNVQNFGLATEDEAKQGISNAKYMTPSLTQAVLSANINSIAYANSADGTDGFTTVYPNLNLLTDTRDFINKDLLGNNQKTSIVSPNSTVLKDGNDTYLNFISTADNQYWLDVYLIPDWSTTPPPDFINANILPNSKYTFSFWAKGTGEHSVTSYGNWTTPLNIINAFTLTNEWKYYSFTVTSSATIPVKNVEFFLRSITTGTEISVKKPKVEEGSIATPYMPSASEVTTADWPKYVGFSNTVKTNKFASDYTWFPVKDSELTNKVDSHINNKANPHSVTASQVGAYTKSETDAKFKVVNDLIISQDIPEGSNLDDYKKEGEFSKKTPTVVTGVPEGVTGAFRLSVRSMVGSSGIFQTLYDYATRGIYYRVGNTSPGFNLPWQRIANNSEVVHLTGDQEIKGTLTVKELVIKKDEPWTDLTPASGISVPNGSFLKYRIKNGYITVIASNVGGTIPASGALQLTTLPVSLFSTQTFVGTVFSGNATNAWRASINGDKLSVHNGAKLTSNAICFTITLPID
ncbi:carbohydrate binding domain-containing protein [Lactococcus garvieae]|uniref:carbohydrate binding domain-containing protein n=1 Tax=Lactococcus garvieae TaxID=1363 RepID=UPI0022E8A1AA|nr:carbohydrate binding domain-containing protein [Lactococcus garvieae]